MGLMDHPLMFWIIFWLALCHICHETKAEKQIIDTVLWWTSLCLLKEQMQTNKQTHDGISTAVSVPQSGSYIEQEELINRCIYLPTGFWDCAVLRLNVHICITNSLHVENSWRDASGLRVAFLVSKHVYGEVIPAAPWALMRACF